MPGLPITVNVDLPTDNTDVLNGTLLEQIPGPGVLNLFIASSQRDGKVTVTGPGVLQTPAYQAAPVLRANGIPDIQADIPYPIVCTGRGRVIIAYDEVGAGDAWATCIFVPG